MNRRELFRRTVLAAAASAAPAAAREFPPGYDASKDLARPDWKPAFLDDHQNRTLIALSDIIIPDTDTPGAKAALVNRFIDLLLAAESPQVRRQFLESLAWLDGEAFARYRNAFLHLPADQQTELVASFAWPQTLATWAPDDARGGDVGYQHFLRLKDWISKSYFNSEPGLRALGYDGPPHGSFDGCKT